VLLVFAIIGGAILGVLWSVCDRIRYMINIILALSYEDDRACVDIVASKRAAINVASDLVGGSSACYM